MQYHPELTLQEIAAATRRQAEDIIDQGLARNHAEVEAQAAVMEQLGDDPDRADLAWRLGVDDQITDPRERHRDLANFIAALCRAKVAA